MKSNSVRKFELINTKEEGEEPNPLLGSVSKLIFEKNLKWLTAQEAKEYLRLKSVEVLRNMVCQRRIPSYKLGRNLRFKVSELDAVLEASRKERRFE